MTRRPPILNALAGLAVALLAMGLPNAAAQLHKCVDNGAVTYQNMPCPASEPRQRPTLDQLNADRQKKLAQARAAAASSSAMPAGDPPARPARSDPGSTDRLRAAPEPAQAAAPAARFSCDGRKYCSQMTSCAEATYFLSRCPGVQMDGNRDGIPCEAQWCRR